VPLQSSRMEKFSAGFRPRRMGPARPWQSKHCRRPAPSGNERNSEPQDQAPGSFSPVCAFHPRGKHCGIFEKSHPSPFMTLAYAVRAEKRDKIPAPTHVDGTGRLQTVTREANPRYHALISAFRDLTGVPVVLNTSFNDNEPIVCRPEEAIDCFLRTQMDALVLGDFLISRS